MKKIIFGSAIVSTIAIGAVVTLMLMYSANVDNTIEDAIRRWRPLADADPGAGNSGVLNIFIYPHSADPGTDYATNITEGAAYAYGHLNSTATGNVPYDTTFDIVVKVRYNATHAKCSSNATWMMGWVNATIRCPDLGINSNTTMSKINITAGVDFIWVHYYMNNGGAGYTISHGETVNATHIITRAYY
jgi:hypothetical protein